MSEEPRTKEERDSQRKRVSKYWKDKVAKQQQEVQERYFSLAGTVFDHKDQGWHACCISPDDAKRLVKALNSPKPDKLIGISRECATGAVISLNAKSHHTNIENKARLRKFVAELKLALEK